MAVDRAAQPRKFFDERVTGFRLFSSSVLTAQEGVIDIEGAEKRTLESHISPSGDGM